MSVITIHPFEKAGLGIAPFKFMRLEEKVYVSCQGASVQVGDCCDYCGTGIRYCCHIRSGDGKNFVVGTDCVMKLERADNILVNDVTRAKNAIAREKREAKRVAKVARENARVAAAIELLESKREALKSQPHPVDGMARDGYTLADYVDWMLQRAGQSGRVRVAAIIEKA